MNNTELKYWLSINRIPNVGPVTIKKLWETFGSIKSAWEADEKSIYKIEGISKPAVKSFLEERHKIALDEELDLMTRKGINVFTLEDEGYPSNLMNIYDPPPVLYANGKILGEDKKAIAIVGTRKASHYGKETARKLAYELSSIGFTIVSGLAAGIDTFAHKGALEANGRTLAIFGTGVDVVYPSTNKSLANEILSSGALVSEFPMGMGPEKGTFPRRNRVISGLSLGVVVVEGHYDSGAMITAKYALDQGREVFAVPGNVGLDQSKGPHWLIKQGAKLIESVEDVLDELNMVLPEKGVPKMATKKTKDYSNLPAEEQRIIKALSSEPKYIDNISAESGLSISEVSSRLMMLEVKKIIRQLPGKMFVLN